LDFILQHLVELFLEWVLQFSTLIRYFSIFLEELTKVFEIKLAIAAPLLQEELHAPAHQVILTAVIFGRDQFIAGIVDELMGLLDLEVIGEGLDEGDDEGLVYL
jgi:hypothetical protein